MLPRSVIDRTTGYRSVYMFDKVDALAIRASGESKGFAQYQVAADELFIDLDDGGKTLPDLEARIVALGYRYEVWESGGKGHHIVLFHDMIVSWTYPTHTVVLFKR